MGDDIKPKRIPARNLFLVCNKENMSLNYTHNNNHTYSTDIKEQTSDGCVDFNYAEVASEEESVELGNREKSLLQTSQNESVEYNSFINTKDDYRVIESMAYFTSLKQAKIVNENTQTLRLRKISYELVVEIESLQNFQLQRYISESGNTALYKYMLPVSESGPEFTLAQYVVPEVLQSSICIDESLGRVAVAPIYRKYQLLGDSQLVRFSEVILASRRWRLRGSRARIGYCVSGQSVAELGARVRASECQLIPNVILLIGTNDMRRNDDILSILEAYSDLVYQLESQCSKIVLLTVPPLAFLHDKDSALHIRRLKILNRFIKGLANENNILVLDLCSLFISFDNEVSKDYFEKFIGADKVDLIHLNKSGFKMLRTLLDAQYFDKYKNQF